MSEPTLFQIIEEVYKDGNPNPDYLQILKDFSSDFSNFPKCKEMLEDLDGSSYVQIFASQALLKLPELYLSSWNIEFSIDLCDWSINYMIKNFLELEKATISNLSDLVASVLEFFWNTSNHQTCIDEWNDIIHILDNEPIEWPPALFLIAAIHDKLLESKDNKVVESFSKDCLPTSFRRIYNIAKRIKSSNVPDFEFILEISLDIIEKCVYDYKKFEIAGLVYKDQINFYFEIYNNFQLFKSLSCLYAVASSVDKNNRSYPEVIELLCDGFFNLLNEKFELFNEDHLRYILTIIAKIATHLRFSVIQQMRLDVNLVNFISMMKELTFMLIQQSSNHDLSTIENAILFWKNIEAALRNDGEVRPKKIISAFAPDLCINYIKCLLNAPNFNRKMETLQMEETGEADPPDDDILEIMEGKLSPLLFPIQNFVFLNHEGICPQLLNGIQEKKDELISSLESSSDDIPASEYQLAFFVEIAIVVLLIKKSGSKPDPKIKYHADFFAQLVLLLQISEEWISNDILLPRLEMTLIMFLSNFKKTLFGCTDPKLSLSRSLYDQLKKKRAVTSFNECQHIFFDRTIVTLQNFNEQNLLFQALSIIYNKDNNVIASRKTLNLIFENPFDQTFSFINKIENINIRSRFMSAIFSIILNFNESDFPYFADLLFTKLDSEFESIDIETLVENDETKKEICFLAVDICGIFNEAKDYISFNPIFEWFISNDRSKLFETAVSIILSSKSEKESGIEDQSEDCNDIVINYILQMWKSIALCTPRTRIIFNFSSPNGVILFSKAATILIQYYNYIEHFERSQELNDSNINAIEYSFSIFQNLVSGRYVPFGAFKIYNDSIFIDLLTALSKMINETFLRSIEMYPSTFRSMCYLFKDLMINQIETLFETAQQLVIIILDYLIRLLEKDNDDELQQYSLDAILAFLQYIYDYDIDCRPFFSQIENINISLWNAILRENSRIDTNVTETLKLLFLLNDQSLLMIKEKMTPKLSICKSTDLEENFKMLQQYISSDDSQSKSVEIIVCLNNIVEIYPVNFVD